MNTQELEAAFMAHLGEQLARLDEAFRGSSCSISGKADNFDPTGHRMLFRAYQKDLGLTEEYPSAASAVESLISMKERRAQLIREDIARQQAELQRMETPA